MRLLKNISLQWAIVSAFTAVVFLLATCAGNNQQKDFREPNDISAFAGDEKCANCHNDYYQKHIHTAHHLTTLPATEENIKGSFKKGDNEFHYSAELSLKMERRDTGLFQVVYFQGQEKMSIPFHLIIGSGIKGQSFAYWKDNSLFQLPATWYEERKEWGNSPGFLHKVQFDRPITVRCLECHATFASVLSEPPGEPAEFKRNEIIHGVGCERCHGAGAEHSRLKTSGSIIDPASFSRQQKIDMCGVCHGGRMQKLKPSFSFTAGDRLSDYFKQEMYYGEADVHGNQVALMESSKCFKAGNVMTCLTCHDPHENQRGRLADFSQKCMSCHTATHKQLPGISTAMLKTDCINCHMPALPSRNIAAAFRTHHIAIYKDSSSVRE